MGQRGFWDEQQRVAKLQEKKPVLIRLAESIPWESFRPLLDKGYSQERKSNAGRKRIDPLILFKMLVLQQLFNLSDEEIEFQVNDRRSFEGFVGLGVMNDIPDATTVAFFRERLRKAGVIEELFEMFEEYLRSQGLQARGGQIIDATLVPVPKQRNTREENKEIKAGRLPEGWDENLDRLQQKDLYAFRGRDAPPHECKPDRSPLSDQRLFLVLSSAFRDRSAVTASPHRGDGRSRPAPGTPRHPAPVA
ncbi:transposase [Synechococcus sp. CBW1107]|uniref:transposase n=1 Tax=Synechococcus sp. CBW1107 TaxID=2789857 RepID=UPI001E57ADCF|nr:transposase [Synechococcus sp. CBW1107]